MPAARQSVSGTWDKSTSSACGESYPDRIVFQDNGLYFGQKQPPGTFTTWDAGKYEIISENQIKLSTATDEIVTYRFDISGDVLTFVDPENCEFKYRKSQ